MSTTNPNPNPNPNTWSEASSDRPSSPSHDSSVTDVEEVAALALKVKLLEAELLSKEQKLIESRDKHEAYLLQERICKLRTGSEHVLVSDGDGNAMPVEHPEARKNIGVIPSALTRGAQLINLKLNYRLSPTQEAIAKERFPGVVFHQPYFGGHDHPLAHLETMLAARRAQAAIQPGQTCLDICGNPGANEGFNKDQSRKPPGIAKKIETLCAVNTEFDEYRKATKWGPPMNSQGEPRWIEGTVKEALATPDFIGRFDCMLSIHTLYYLTIEEIALMVNSGDTRVKRPILHAVVHRHKMGEHEFFNGELAYKHDGMSVRQVAVETGREFNHASIEWVWKNSTKVKRCVVGDRRLGFTWDLEKFTDDTWIIHFVACSPDDDEGVTNRVVATGVDGAVTLADWQKAYNASNQYMDSGEASYKPKLTEIAIQGGKVERVGKALLFSVPWSEESITVDNVPFYEHLQHQIVGKPREPKSLASLFAVARRDSSGSTYPGTKKYQVRPERIADHVMAAFLAGLDRENTLLAAATVKAYDMRTHEHLSSSFNMATAPALNLGTIRGLANLSTVPLRILGKNKVASHITELAS